MRYDVTTLGELVIDLVPIETPSGLAYSPKPGGAPGNVAAGVARFGLAAAMITKVGTEAFGAAAVSALKAAGVSTEAVVHTADHNTALAVVTKTPAGETDFFFYRENCADSQLVSDEIRSELIAGSRVLHVGTLLLATPVSAAAQRHAIGLAGEKGPRVSVDLNFRAAFWRDLDRMRDAGLEMVRAANIVKVSRDELALLTGGSTDTEAAVRSLWHDRLIVFAVTKGAAGADLFTAGERCSAPGFPVTPVDTVGCGDAFMASLLAGLIECGFDPRRDLKTIATQACAAGALMATQTGALESMPSRQAIGAFLRERVVGYR
jgi:fructokinase